MQKISGILPPSSRITSVDNRSLAPVRPGAPGFGRPEGSSEITDRVSRSSVARMAGEGDIKPNYKMPKELVHRGIADRVAKSFFTDPRGGKAQIEDTLDSEVDLNEPEVATGRIIKEPALKDFDFEGEREHQNEATSFLEDDFTSL